MIRKKIGVVMAALLISGSVSLYAQAVLAQKTALIKSVSVSPRACKFKQVVISFENGVEKTKLVDCPDNNKHGDVYITYTNGRKVRASNRGVADGAYAISPDRRTVAWSEGRHEATSIHNLGRFTTTKLFVYRNGKIVRQFDDKNMPYMYVWTFGFWNQGKEITIVNGPSHGLVTYCRYDIATGRLLNKVREKDVVEKRVPLPNWIKPLVNE